MSVCIYAPSLASPLAGVLADRVRRRRLLLGLNTFPAVVLLALLAVRGRAGLWIIFVVMTWYGMELTISGPAENGLFVEMLPAELRRRLNDWNLGLQETGRLVAPLVGAGLFALVGGGSVALLDAGTFALAAVMIRRLRLDEARSSPGPPRWRSEVVAGFGPILETPELRRILLAGAVVIGISGVGVAAQYSLVQALGEPPSFLGVLNAALGAGSIVASLTSSPVVRRIGEVARRPRHANFALGNLLRASGRLPAAVVVGSLVLGFGLPWVFLAVVDVAQRTTPVGLQGRVSAAVLLALFGPQAPLQAVGSAAISETSYSVVYVASATAALLGGAWLARGLVRRPRLERRAPSPRRGRQAQEGRWRSRPSAPRAATRPGAPARRTAPCSRTPPERGCGSLVVLSPARSRPDSGGALSQDGGRVSGGPPARPLLWWRTCQPADEVRRGSRKMQPSGQENGRVPFAPSRQRSTRSARLTVWAT